MKLSNETARIGEHLRMPLSRANRISSTSAILLAMLVIGAASDSNASTVDVYGLNGADNSSGVGGNGQDIILSNSIATDANSNPGGNLISNQNANGGYGGGSGTTSGGNGGLGSSSLTYTDTTAAQVHAFVWGVGGGGGWGHGGGKGGDASSALNITANSAASVFEQSIAEAGAGGSSIVLTGNNEFNPGIYVPTAGNGGAGGNATTSANGITSSASTLTVNSTARGGDGGLGISSGYIGGKAGTAATTASGISTNGATVIVYALQGGGNGGDGGFLGADGANGADSIMTNAVSGSTSGNLYFYQFATAGNGGNSGTGTAGNGGNASSILSRTDHSASSLNGTVYAFAGRAGVNSTSTATNGNAYARVKMVSTVAGAPVFDNVIAYGGNYLGDARAVAIASGKGTDTTISATARSEGLTGFARSMSSSSGDQSVKVYAYAPMNNRIASAVTRVGADAGSLALDSGSQAIASGYAGTSTTTSLNTANGNFTVVGSGKLGAISNGGAGTYDYISKANFVFTPPSGNDLFLNLNSLQSGTGFESAVLTVTENSKSIFTSIFSSYASFLSFINIPTNLGAVSGKTSINIALVEALAGLSNGQTATFQLAMAQTGTVTGQYRIASTSAVPLPNSLALFAMAILGMFGLFYYHKRKDEALLRIA